MLGNEVIPYELKAAIILFFCLLDEQFGIIRQLRDKFEKNAHPVISVDTKKKELVGQFKNPGRTWQQTPVLVNDHDFRSDGKGMAAPYGIYDTTSNRGFVCVGKSHDTAEFAVDSIVNWWTHDGRKKYQLQHKLCNTHGLMVSAVGAPPLQRNQQKLGRPTTLKLQNRTELHSYYQNKDGFDRIRPACPPLLSQRG